MQRLVFAGPHVCTHQLLAQCLIQYLVDQRAFPGAGNPRYSHEAPQREPHVDIFQVVFRRTDDLQKAAVAGASYLRQRDLLRPGKVLPGNGLLAVYDLLGRAAVHHMPAVYAGAGANIHNVIGRLHRFLVMLHHNDGVAEVPQVFQRLDEPCIIPLVQPDGRLIEDIQHPHQAGADLGCQPDTLTFPAGKGAGAAGQRQIIEPHIRKEGKPALYFLDDLPGDFLLHLGQLQLVHEFQCFPHAHLAEIADIDAAHRYRQYFGTQPVAVAGRAGDSRHKSSDIILHPVAGGLLKAPLQVIDDALEVIGELPGKPGGMPHHLKLFPLGAEQHKVQLILRHILDRDIQRHTEVLFQPGEVHLPDGTGVAAPARNLEGTVPDGTVGVAHHQRRVNLLENAQSGAGGAASRRIVEGKHIGGKLLDGDIMVRAGIVLAEKHLLTAHNIHYHQPAGHGTAGLY